MDLLLYTLLSSHVKFWNNALCANMLTAVAYGCALFAAALDLAPAAVETCGLFGIHRYLGVRFKMGKRAASARYLLSSRLTEAQRHAGVCKPAAVLPDDEMMDPSV